MTHAQLDQLFRQVLGRGMYTSQILLSRLRRAILAAGYDVQLDSYDDLAKLPAEALQPAADYLGGSTNTASPDTARAARIGRKAS